LAASLRSLPRSNSAGKAVTIDARSPAGLASINAASGSAASAMRLKPIAACN
jgi:hypothetical protein